MLFLPFFDRLLRYIKDFAKKRHIEITVTSGRIRQLPVWKENKAHRESGKMQYRGDMSDVADENAEDDEYDTPDD